MALQDRIPRTPPRVRRAFDSIGSTYVPYTGAILDVDLGAFNIITTGLGTFGNLDVDTLNFNGNVISDSSGTISFDNEHLTTTGLGTFGDITIFNPTPILVFRDSNSVGDASVGFTEWRDSNNTRLGFFGNSSSGNDDLLWKNESSGGHIKIETTGAGEFQIIANTVLDGNLTTTGTLIADDIIVISPVNIYALSHDSFANFVANEHIDWTNTDENLVTTGLITADTLILNKATGKGIKIDTASPTFGWRDLLGQPTALNVGASKPTFAVYRDTLLQYQFAAGDEEYFEFHIPHDYVGGTDIHLHFHWSHTGTLVNGGTVTWEYEMSYSKSHNQAAFPASVTGTVVGTASTTQYQQILSEGQVSAASPSGSQIDTDDLEPDGVILLRIGVQTNGITVSGGGVPDPFLHYVDVHYRSTNISTKDKAPDFYA